MVAIARLPACRRAQARGIKDGLGTGERGRRSYVAERALACLRTICAALLRPRDRTSSRVAFEAVARGAENGSEFGIC